MTDILHLLPDFSLQPFSNIIPSLEKHNITVTDLLIGDASDLAKRAQVPLRDIRNLTETILLAFQKPLSHPESQQDAANGACIPSLVTSGKDILSRWRTISLLDDTIDTALGGGIPTGYLTEVTGESGVGKTQFLLTLLLAVQLAPPAGSSRSAIYISTEAPLATSRLSQLLTTHPRLAGLSPSEKPSLSKVLALQVPDLESQDHILRYQLPVAIARHNVGLVIVDSITANYRAEFDVAGNKKDVSGTKKQSQPLSMARRSARLLEIGSQLRELAREKNIAIVVANQVSDRFMTDGAQTSARRQVPPSSSSPVTLMPQLDGAQDHEQGHGPSSTEPPAYSFNSTPHPAGVPSVMTLDYQQNFFSGWGASMLGRPTASDTRLKTPSLGLVWANQIACRIALVKTPVRTQFAYGHDNTRWKRHMKVVFAPWTQGEDGGRGVQFIIEGEGVKGISGHILAAGQQDGKEATKGAS